MININNINMEYYIQLYIDENLEKTYNINDKVLSCAVQYDVLQICKLHNLKYNSHIVSQLLMIDKNIKKKTCGGSQYYIGLKYKKIN